MADSRSARPTIAAAQLQAGTIDIITSLNTQTTLYSDLDALTQIRLARFQALLNLYKALGGGFGTVSGATSCEAGHPDRAGAARPGRRRRILVVALSCSIGTEQVAERGHRARGPAAAGAAAARLSTPVPVLAGHEP